MSTLGHKARIAFLTYLGTCIYGFLALLVAIGYIASRGASYQGGIVAALSVFLFILLEYLSHRFLLHPHKLGAGVINKWTVERLHLGHHLRPVTRLYRPVEVAGGAMVFGFGILPAVAIFALFGHMLTPGQPLPAIVTLLVCSAFHEYVHRLSHLKKRSRFRWINVLCRHHQLHHYYNEKFNYGMITMVMDRLLRTYCPDSRHAARSETRFTLGLSSSLPIFRHHNRFDPIGPSFSRDEFKSGGGKRHVRISGE